MLKESDVKNTTTFLAKISHELKSPIHGIMGVSGYLVDHWDEVDDNEKKRYITEVNNTASALNFLVLSLLTTNVIGGEGIKYNMSKIHFRAHVLEIVESMRIFLVQKQGLYVHSDIDVDSDEILADSVWFKQLLSNIFINAIKFASKGIIICSVKKERIKEKIYYVFSISDEGIGVPESEIASIFMPFTKASTSINDPIGTGLGLSICTEIVEAHGGWIRGYNNERNGLTVEFTIPAIDPS